MRSLSLAIALSACGSSSSTNQLEVDAPPEPPKCEAATETIDLAADHAYALVGLSADARGVWGVVEKKKDMMTSIVIVDRTGEVATLASGLPEASGLRVALVNAGGKRCVAFHFFDEKFKFACEDGALEAPDLELGGDLVALEIGGKVHVFGQDFAAYHELRREGGTWRQVEKFESSVSRAEDAIAIGAGFHTCFLATGGRVAMDTGTNDNFYGPAAKWCRLLPGDSVGVLTDKGLGTFAGGVFGAQEATALADQRPLAVRRTNGASLAVVRRDPNVELQPLPAGTPALLRTLDGSQQNVLATMLADRVAVYSMKSRFENGMSRYQLTASTHCM